MFLYCGTMILTGRVPHIAAVTAGQFFEGLLSAIPTIIVAGSIEDMYGAEK